MREISIHIPYLNQLQLNDLVGPSHVYEPGHRVGGWQSPIYIGGGSDYIPEGPKTKLEEIQGGGPADFGVEALPYGDPGPHPSLVGPEGEDLRAGPWRGTQAIFDILGTAPVVGEPFDFLSGTMSLGEGLLTLNPEELLQASLAYGSMFGADAFTKPVKASLRIGEGVKNYKKTKKVTDNAGNIKKADNVPTNQTGNFDNDFVPTNQFHQRLDDAYDMGPGIYSPISKYDMPRTYKPISTTYLDRAKELVKNFGRGVKNFPTNYPRTWKGLKNTALYWGLPTAAYGTYDYLTGDPNQDFYNEGEEDKTLKFNPEILDSRINNPKVDPNWTYKTYQDSLNQGLLRN